MINFINRNLSGVLTCLFLESSPFKYRLRINTTYFKYIDNILIFLPQNIKDEKVADKLNNIELSINFTYEKESNNSIYFLHVLIKSQNSFSFKVYCKPSNKIDYIHFYSHYNTIKTSLIISFYLQALKICSPQYLDEEFKYIEHSLKRLKYPKFFKINGGKKALNIHSSNKLKKNTLTIPIMHRPRFPPTHTEQTSVTN